MRPKKADLKLNVQKTKIMASSPIPSWQIDGEKMEAVTDPIFLGSKITADGNCSHEIQRNLFFGRRAMTNLVQFSSITQSCSTLRIHELQVSLSITNSWSLPKLMSIESVLPSNQLILCLPFSSCPQSFPPSGTFQISQLFASGGQSTGVSASASVLSVNTQDWSPSGWIGWISLLSKGLSRVFSNTTVQKHQFFGAQLSL